MYLVYAVLDFLAKNNGSFVTMSQLPGNLCV